MPAINKERLVLTVQNVVDRLQNDLTDPNKIDPKLAELLQNNRHLRLYLDTWIAGPLMLAISDSEEHQAAGLRMSR